MQLAQLAHAMPAERFETLIRELLAQMGFDENTVKVTPYSGDGLIDVTGTLPRCGYPAAQPVAPKCPLQSVVRPGILRQGHW